MQSKSSSSLVSSSPLYQEQGVPVDQNWMTNIQPTSNFESHCCDGILNNSDNSCTSDDEWAGDEPEIPAGVTDSMLTPPDFVNDSER